MHRDGAGMQAGYVKSTPVPAVVIVS